MEVCNVGIDMAFWEGEGLGFSFLVYFLFAGIWCDDYRGRLGVRLEQAQFRNLAGPRFFGAYLINPKCYGEWPGRSAEICHISDR